MAHVQLVALTTGMDTIHVWQQHQGALERTVVQLADAVNALAQGQTQAIQRPPKISLHQRIHQPWEKKPPLGEEDVGEYYPPLGSQFPEWESGRRR